MKFVSLVWCSHDEQSAERNQRRRGKDRLYAVLQRGASLRRRRQAREGHEAADLPAMPGADISAEGEGGVSERGFFEIGIVRGKTPANVGTLWRSAFQMGAAGIFTIGRRYPQQASDTVKSYRHIPCREFLDFDSFMAALPIGCPIVGIEMGGKSLPTFTHPERCIYLLGAEDAGIPAAILARCHHRVALPSIRTESYNVAVAGSLVMYDRQMKRGGWSEAA